MRLDAGLYQRRSALVNGIEGFALVPGRSAGGAFEAMAAFLKTEQDLDQLYNVQRRPAERIERAAGGMLLLSPPFRRPDPRALRANLGIPVSIRVPFSSLTICMGPFIFVMP